MSEQLITSIYQHVGKRIQIERVLRGMTQWELARLAGVTANTISRWETATYKISLEDLCHVAYAMNLTPVDLMPIDKATNKHEEAVNSLVHQFVIDLLKVNEAGTP